LFARLAQGTPKLGQVAKELAFGERTLQRHLRKLDTSFGELLETVRQERYDELSTSGGKSEEDLAQALGYSDARSLRRWRRKVSERLRTQDVAASAPGRALNNLRASCANARAKLAWRTQ